MQNTIFWRKTFLSLQLKSKSSVLVLDPVDFNTLKSSKMYIPQKKESHTSLEKHDSE